MRSLDCFTDVMYMNLGIFQEVVRDREAWLQSTELQRVGRDSATE